MKFKSGICRESTNAVALHSGQNSIMLITLESGLKMYEIQVCSWLFKIPWLVLRLGEKGLIFVTVQSAIKMKSSPRENRAMFIPVMHYQN